jgi:hypothetical protein
MNMIWTAQKLLMQKWHSLDGQTRTSLSRLLNQATQSWWDGRMDEIWAEQGFRGRHGASRKVAMATWGAACTNYATAQLYGQMITTKLSRD